MKHSIIQTILSINPNAKVSVNSEDIDNIIWHDGTTEISKADIQAKQTELDNANSHVVVRIESYPSIGEQFDMMYKDQVNGTTTWKDAIAKVKSDNPKT